MSAIELTSDEARALRRAVMARRAELRGRKDRLVVAPLNIRGATLANMAAEVDAITAELKTVSGLLTRIEGAI